MVSSRQHSQSSLLRDAWVEIDLDAIEQNVALVRSWLDPARCGLMAVVKSDAYGHGANRVAEILVAKGAKYLAVASVDEGIELRKLDSKIPILILAPIPFWAVGDALANDLDMTVTSLVQLRSLEKLARNAESQAKIHIKIDTGMHRLGFSPDQINEALELGTASKNLALTSMFSHLAKASDREAVEFQNANFMKVVEESRVRGIKIPVHIASSEAAEKFPFAHHDLVRVGIYLYGLRPKSPAGNLTPALSVRGRIMNIAKVPEGDSAGYNWTWTASRDSRLASIPIGYADGVDRNLSNRIEGFLMGKRVPQTGLISMDQMLFDITDVPEAQEGDVITLIGHGEGADSPALDLADWSSKLDTITYELACRLRARLPKIYTRNQDKNEKVQNDLEMTTG